MLLLLQLLLFLEEASTRLAFVNDDGRAVRFLVVERFAVLLLLLDPLSLLVCRSFTLLTRGCWRHDSRAGR